MSPRLRDQAKGLPPWMLTPLMYAWWTARGEWPAPFAQWWQHRRSRSPRGFNDKVRYKMARDRRPLLTTLADKVAARHYAAERIPSHYLPSVIAVAARPADIPWQQLPDEFVCRVNHGSGGIIVVTRQAASRARLPRSGERPGWSRWLVHPEAVTVPEIVGLLEHWLTLAYGQGPGGPPEWCYRDIERQVVVEEYLPSVEALPRQLNVYCFHGHPCAFVTMGRDAGFVNIDNRRFLREEWREAAGTAGLDDEAWRSLMSACAALSRETDFLRVDWLLGASGPVLSELTNYPCGGNLPFDGHRSLTPAEVDRSLSSYWTVPEAYV